MKMHRGETYEEKKCGFAKFAQWFLPNLKVFVFKWKDGEPGKFQFGWNLQIT